MEEENLFLAIVSKNGKQKKVIRATSCVNLNGFNNINRHLTYKIETETGLKDFFIIKQFRKCFLYSICVRNRNKSNGLLNLLFKTTRTRLIFFWKKSEICSCSQLTTMKIIWLSNVLPLPPFVLL